MAYIFPKLFNPISKSHVVKKIVHTPPQHLFSIVTDVESYKDFLPFCKHSKILRRSECGTMFDASLVVGISHIPPLNKLEEEYVSRVTQQYVEKNPIGNKEWLVEARSIRSKLFDSLSSIWKMTECPISTNGSERPRGPCDNNYIRNISTQVEFQVEMTVSDPIVVAALDQVLTSVAEQQVAAFEHRCKVIPFKNESVRRQI